MKYLKTTNHRQSRKATLLGIGAVGQHTNKEMCDQTQDNNDERNRISKAINCNKRNVLFSPNARNILELIDTSLHQDSTLEGVKHLIDKIANIEGQNMQSAETLVLGYFYTLNYRNKAGRLMDENQVLESFNRELVENNLKITGQFQVLKREAKTDALTGLRNRREFDIDLKILKEKAKQGSEIFSLIMVDIDHFKGVNDTYGHPKGDEVLQTIACIMKSCTREGDIVTRYGGEEFAILLPGANLSGAKVAAEKIRKAIEEEAEFETDTGIKFRVTASLGISSIDQSKDDIVESADKALYHSKHKQGRNCVSYFDPSKPEPVKFNPKRVGVITGKVLAIAE